MSVDGTGNSVTIYGGYAGGIVGKASSGRLAPNEILVKSSCSNSGSVISEHYFAAGIIGYVNPSDGIDITTIESGCGSSGNVVGNKAEDANGHVNYTDKIYNPRIRIKFVVHSNASQSGNASNVYKMTLTTAISGKDSSDINGNTQTSAMSNNGLTNLRAHNTFSFTISKNNSSFSDNYMIAISRDDGGTTNLISKDSRSLGKTGSTVHTITIDGTTSYTYTIEILGSWMYYNSVDSGAHEADTHSFYHPEVGHYDDVTDAEGNVTGQTYVVDSEAWTEYCYGGSNVSKEAGYYSSAPYVCEGSCSLGYSVYDNTAIRNESVEIAGYTWPSS